MTFSPEVNTLCAMPDTRSHETAPRSTQPFWRTAWPEIGGDDPDSLRRRKLSVRVGHLAMAFLVFVAAGSTPLVFPADYPAWSLAALLAAGLGYVLWNIIGTGGLVTLVLWEGSEAPSLALRRPRCGSFVFFVVQIGLAVFIYGVSDRGRVPNLAWLVLLPPVAYAVFILEGRGIFTISLLMLATITLSIHRTHGWAFAGYAALAFSFALLFTIVFSMLAVQSEKARNEVQRLAQELGEANRRLREYAVQAEELSATRERNRIAREIHDTLGHFLTVANVQLEAARVLAPTDPAKAREAAGKAQAFVQEGLQDIRRSVAALRSSPLDNKPLAQALQELVNLANTESPAADFAVLGTPRKLASPVELSLYRAAQEGLTNARKHAHAKSLRVRLDFQIERTVALSVQDDGDGAAMGPEQSGFGLRGLRERAHLLGGTLEIQTAPNAGFLLKFEVPA
jgi:signal transduction histidine kinase